MLVLCFFVQNSSIDLWEEINIGGLCLKFYDTLIFIHQNRALKKNKPGARFKRFVHIKTLPTEGGGHALGFGSVNTAG